MVSSGGGSEGVVLERLFVELESVGVAGEEEGAGRNRLELLTSLKTALGNLSRAQLSTHINALNLQVLFNCLDSNNMEQIESTCEILKSLMNIIEPVPCLEKYHEAIQQGFSHPVPEVPALIMAHLTRCIEADEGSLNSHPSLRIAVINQLAAEELRAAKEADKLLLKYGGTEAGKEFFLSDEAVGAFHALIASKDLNDSKKFRVYENVTNIATISPQHFTRLDGSLGLMDLLVKLSFKSDDFLGQINALEIISILVGCPHGQEALRGAGVFQEIQILSSSVGTPMGEILLPGIIKFIGKVGAVSLPPLEMIQLVLQTLGGSDKKNYPLRTVATEAFAFIGSTVEGKRYYKTLPDIKKYFQLIRELIFEASTDNRARGLDAMSIFFGSDEANEDCLTHWFNVLLHDMSELFEMLRLPFPELRLSGLNFLSSIAHLEWAQRHYLRGPGVIEFLIGREPEPVKECVYAKFRLVKIIVDSPSTTKILTPEQMAQLKLYIHQGPFYAHAESTVITSDPSS